MSESYGIGQVAGQLGVSVDTLRYYEKIGLLPRVDRTPAGIRRYSARDVSRLRSIRRAQKMDFSLDEIGCLLRMRDDPRHARDEVRRLTAKKLEEVEGRISELETLRRELTLLVNLCRASDQGCPIIETMEEGSA